MSLAKLIDVQAEALSLPNAVRGVPGGLRSFFRHLPAWQIPLQRALLKCGGVDLLCHMMSSQSVAIRRRAAALVKKLVSSPLHRPDMGGWRRRVAAGEVLGRAHSQMCQCLDRARERVRAPPRTTP